MGEVLRDIWADQKGLSPLVVTVIIAAMAGAMALGIYASWAPKLKNLNERSQGVLGN